jgi:hypothetical protein
MGQSPSLECTLLIGDVEYRVIVDRAPDDRFGQVSFDQNVILIEKDVLPVRQVKVLLHEIIHAMMFEHGSAILDKREDEEQTQKWVQPLYDLLTRNPFIGGLIAEYLQSAEQSGEQSSVQEGNDVPSRKKVIGFVPSDDKRDSE